MSSHLNSARRRRRLVATLFACAGLFGVAPFSGAAGDIPHPPLRVARMMGQTGMGQGMMGGAQAGTAGDSASSTRAQAAADQLLHYIREQQLACLRCHAVNGPGFGPSFHDIAASAAGDPAAARRLVDSIVNGVRRMPPGTASPKQAQILVHDILRLNGDGPTGGTH